MKIVELKKRLDIDPGPKMSGRYLQFEKILLELEARDIPGEIVWRINDEVESLNELGDSIKSLKKPLAKAQSKVLKLIRKELQLVVINHYRKVWMSICGLIGFLVWDVFPGNPLGMLVFPACLTVGFFIGAVKDKNARKNGKQLTVKRVF